MSDDEPTDDSEQQSEEQPADSDQSAEQAEEQPADDQPEQQSDEQPADDQPAEPSEEQPTDTDQPAEQAEEQPAESDQPAEQAEEQPADTDQAVDQSGEQPADSDQSEASASADNTLAFAGGTASPGGGGGGTFEARRPPRPSRTPAPVKRRFAFGFNLISDGVPDALQNKIPTLEGGELDFVINEEISPGKTRRVGDSVTASIDLEASLSGVVHFASTVGTNFSIEYIVSPPAGVGGTPLPRVNKVNPSDWKVTKQDAAGRKLNPGGAFVVRITVPVVFVLAQVPPGSTLDAELQSQGIDRTDIAFQSPPKSGTSFGGARSPTDLDAKPVQDFEILIWGERFFTATATKYLP
jgi:chemotaxis protein histidine kinase CheA